MKKEKINSVEFVKCICALGIIISHFFIYLGNSKFTYFYIFANGELGSICAQIFFMVSGALLFYNYEDKIKLKNYYKKRWKSIFPMFYVAYISVELSRIIEYKFFYREGLKPYLFTVLGLDGYLSQTVKTYYILGEWFLGMIIILYIIFPLVLKIFKKNDLVCMFSVTFIYVLFLNKSIVNPTPLWSITSCLFSFVFGIYVIKNRNFLINKVSATISFVSILILVFYPMHKSSNICTHLFAGYLFMFLMYVGEFIMKNKTCYKIFKTISKYSYAIFLFQHIAIVEILSRHYTTIPIKILGLLIIDILVTFILAVLLTRFTNLIIKGLNKITKILFRKKKNLNHNQI
jgi:surface polysaccharide O-acyltransferase-like enzyme